MNDRILIGALGSLVMGDDGIAPRLLAMIEQRFELPERVDLIDIGTPGLGLMSYIIGYGTVILIDAVHDSGAPGDVIVYGREQILARPLQARVGPHDPAVSESLLTADMLGEPIETIRLIGIIPEECRLNTELSSTLNARLEIILQIVIEELGRMGIVLIPKDILEHV